MIWRCRFVSLGSGGDTVELFFTEHRDIVAANTMRKLQARHAFNPARSLAEQFDILAA